MKDLSQRNLSQLKETVTKNLSATIEAGLALKEIRDRKLYLEECGSFQEFCETNWGVTRQRAYQLIDSAEITNELPRSLSTAVDTEAAARELKKVPKEDRAQVVARAREAGKITAPGIVKAAREVKPPAVYDGTGFEIPQGSPALATWLRCPEIQEMLTNLSRIKGTLERAKDAREPMFAEVNYTNIISDLQSSYGLLKVALPFAVCPTCQGRVRSPCTTCNGRGMVSEFYWKHKVPEETKEIREKAIALKNQRNECT